MKRQLSGPTLELFRHSGVSADAVDHTLDGLVRARKSAILRTNHPLLNRVRQASGISLAQISRRSHHLLIEIEQQKDGKPCWQYRELSPRNCRFSCHGDLPATIETALNGELLDKLVLPTLAMPGTLIEHVAPTGDGWLNIDVRPPWHSF